MAKIMFGAVVAQIRGSISGNVFSRNANGAYIRVRTKPSNTNTTEQKVARINLGATSRAWKDLSDGDKNSWIDNASQYPYKDKVGNTATYTGTQLYMKVNTALRYYGLTPLSTMVPPVSLYGLRNLSVTTADISSSTLNFTITFVLPDGTTSTTVPADSILIVEATGMKSSGLYRPKDSDFQYLNKLLESTVVTTVNLNTLWRAKFGTPVADSFAFFRVKAMSTATGQQSDYFWIKFQWVA